ncbi:MAG: peptide ABC transporter substrate-binding protein [Anaerolineae bacterium]|nr:peptide ABC transporter substrate-binding protein [Anaerolineae bacterium]
MTRHLVVALVGISLIFFILFQLASSLSTIEVPAVGGAYREGVLGYSDAISPILLTQDNVVDRDLCSLIFNGLTALDDSGRLLPVLATEWQVSADGTAYDFELRRGVTWHDGVPFTAADVAFTIQAIQDPNFQGDPALRELWQNVAVETQGDYKVRFVLSEPFIPFIYYTTVGVLPAHLLSDVLPADLPTNEFSTQHPIGTGMFKVEEVTPDRVTLVANADFWGPQPYLQRLEIWSFGDWDSMLAAYKRGDIQGIYRVSPEHLSELAQLPDLQLYSAQQAGYGLIYLNLQRESAPFFQDRNVRQALLYALDRQALIDNALRGQGIVANSPIPPTGWAYDPTVRRYPFDSHAAMVLLDSAGWSDTNGDRIRDKDGVEMVFALFTSDDPLMISMAEAIAQYWQAIGVDARVQPQGADLLSNVLQSSPRNFDAALIEVGLAADPDPYPWWHSTQIGEGGQNFSGFANREADIAIEQARAIPDQQRRTELYYTFQEIFADEVPSLLIYYPIYTYAVDLQVQGVQLSPLLVNSDRFRNIDDWYVEMQQIAVTEKPPLDKTQE